MAEMMTAPLRAIDAVSDHWLAFLAHELLGPLSCITLALDALRPSCRDATSREACDVAELGSRQMARIIEDVLTLSDGREGRRSNQRRPTDLIEAAAAAASVVRPLIADAGHRFVLELPRRPLLIAARKSRVEQILTNLLTNAAKYTRPGGNVSLTVCCEELMAVVRVTDDGIGIPADLLPLVFDFGRRGNAGEAQAPAGLGIGLAVVKTLVEVEGGSVSAGSEGPGLGSEFVVRLPLWRS